MSNDSGTNALQVSPRLPKKYRKFASLRFGGELYTGYPTEITKWDVKHGYLPQCENCRVPLNIGTKAYKLAWRRPGTLWISRTTEFVCRKCVDGE